MPQQTTCPHSSTSCLLPDQSLKLQNNLSTETSFLQRLTCTSRHKILHLPHFLSPNATAASLHSLNTLLHFVCVSFLNSHLAAYMTDICTSRSTNFTSLNCHLHMATEEQCHLFTLLCILSYNELHYLTNLLFFIKKRSTDLAQKYMPHMTHSHQYHMIQLEWPLSLNQ